MCGITAVFGNKNDKKDFLIKSLDKVKHRGTEFFELKVFEKGALGANRLPIVGRLEGQQPLSNEDETIFAVQNGEIFNYKELKKSLENKGHKFKTTCDTEVLVHLYEEYKEDMIQYIDSEIYAFIIYDTKKDGFFVARDRFGLKPLYYTKDLENNYYFASELKQLSQFNFIDKIFNFPKGHCMYNKKLKKYYSLEYSNKITNLTEAKRELTKKIVEAVRKRVDTDLPIAVLLSGGVDSSLIMEIATRFHKNVTAFILGRPGSPDYEAALKLCKDNHYKFRVVYPEVNYDEEIESIIYHLESYEAQVIRQCFALDILSKAVVRAGFRIALAGDASDEIFGGYNQFSSLKNENINKGCLIMMNDLERGHNLRLDRMSMKHTLEIRAPLFDTNVVNYAMKINGNLKIKRKNHQIITKYILRKVAEDFLPDYITWRYKIAFSNGAGMNVGFNFRSQDGEVARQILEKRKPIVNKEIIKKYGFLTDEELVYFQIYRGFNYNKLDKDYKRILIKDNLTEIDKKSGETRLLIAEFGKLPLYFPIYLASRIGTYKKHNLSIEYISTGGDDLTYNSLLNGSAQVGIADPIFTFAENPTGIKGKIVGQLVGKVPLQAVTLDPTIKITNLKDFQKYSIGTFQKFSTTNTLVRELFPNKDIKSYQYSEVVDALKKREIDIAIVIAEFAYDLAGKGGHIIYSFENHFKEYLLTGINIADNLDPKFFKSIKAFTNSIRESINFIQKNKNESMLYFKKEFPEILNQKELFEFLITCWNKKLSISDKAVKRLIHTWKTVYPWLLKSNTPQFIEPREEDKIISIFNKRNISRDIPYRGDLMAERIKKAIDEKKSIPLIGFWGASNKNSIDKNDLEALKKFKTINKEVKCIYPKGLEITFLLADEHANLNKFDSKNYIKYLKSIKTQINKFGFKAIYISKIWKMNGISGRLIQLESKKISEKDWRDLSSHKNLENSAKNLGFTNYKYEAKRYYIMRKIESEIIKNQFNSFIFFTQNEDILQTIFPDMPTIYLWVGNRGHAILPWFNIAK